MFSRVLIILKKLSSTNKSWQYIQLISSKDDKTDQFTDTLNTCLLFLMWKI